MVNIQIRGNLIKLVLEELSSNEISVLKDRTDSEVNLLNGIKENKIIDRKSIYQNILPIIDHNLELQVSSFENDNYYDDGYTFYRSNLDNMSYQNNDINIPLKKFNLEYFLIKLYYGYGAGFETEIMDLDYKNFETDKLQINSTSIFDRKNKAAHSLNLNYLELQDLGRNKFEILETNLLLVKNNQNLESLDLGTKMSSQLEIVTSIKYS